MTSRKRSRYMYCILMYLMCIPKCILDSFGIRVKYMQNIKIHVFSWNITGHLRYILRYIRIHKGYMYPSEYMQDTCMIHQNTSGYVSDRKPPPKRIGNPPAPSATHHQQFNQQSHRCSLRFHSPFGGVLPGASGRGRGVSAES